MEVERSHAVGREAVGLEATAQTGTKEWGLGLAVGHGDPAPGEAGQAADSATLARREAQPNDRIGVPGLVETAAEPITEVVTAQKGAAREPAQRAATEAFGGTVDLSLADIRCYGMSVIS
jgi:hypothetical protein